MLLMNDTTPRGGFKGFLYMDSTLKRVRKKKGGGSVRQISSRGKKKNMT